MVGCITVMPFKMRAQVTDTLTPVELHSKKPLDISNTPTNVQQLNKNSLSQLNSVSVAEAVKYFSGVVVKDYGGIGGLKTVSVRSLGAGHTGVMYDGIMISDAQGGQVDLGRFSLDNIELLQLFNNQPPDILLPARSFASASVIALTTSTVNSNSQPATNIGVSLKAGSFGFFDPSFYIKIKPGRKFSTALNAEYQSAKGDYNYIDYETGKSEHTRTNSDIKTCRLEYDAAYAVHDSNQFKFKTYYYNSKRGLPGAVILYSDQSDERLDNEHFFSQLTWQNNISRKSRLLISSKYSYDYKFYLDPSYPNSAGKLENKFHQSEWYASVAYSYKIMPAVTAGYAIDYFMNTLKRTDAFAGSFANPERNSLLNNLSLQWKKKRFEISGNLLHSFVTGDVEQGPVADDLKELTPAIAASVQPFNKVPVRVRASYKRVFRIPGFDDLYYTNIGNTALRPEYADLYSAGITTNIRPAAFIREMVITTDAYYNNVKDKIVAVPRQNLFQWTMLNIGAASIKGIDAAAHIDFNSWREFHFSAGFSYSYQQALDITDPSDANYKTQLPYVPLHSGSMNFSMQYRKLSFAYNIIASSYRYRMGQQLPENIVDGWATHDINLGYILGAKHMQYKFIAEANNIYNTQYEIIRYYPMPRFNYRLGIIVSFKNRQ